MVLLYVCSVSSSTPPSRNTRGVVEVISRIVEGREPAVDPPSRYTLTSSPNIDSASSTFSAGLAPVVLALLTASGPVRFSSASARSEEHTSELQSRFDLVCRLLLEKKKHDAFLV